MKGQQNQFDKINIDNKIKNVTLKYQLKENSSCFADAKRKFGFGSKKM